MTYVSVYFVTGEQETRKTPEPLNQGWKLPKLWNVIISLTIKATCEDFKGYVLDNQTSTGMLHSTDKCESFFPLMTSSVHLHIIKFRPLRVILITFSFSYFFYQSSLHSNYYILKFSKYRKLGIISCKRIVLGKLQFYKSSIFFSIAYFRNAKKRSQTVVKNYYLLNQET